MSLTVNMNCQTKIREFQKLCLSQPTQQHVQSMTLTYGTFNQQSQNSMVPMISLDMSVFNDLSAVETGLSTFCSQSCDRIRQDLTLCNLASDLFIQKQLYCQKTDNRYCYSFYFEKLGKNVLRWEYSIPDADSGSLSTICTSCTPKIYEILRVFGDPNYAQEFDQSLKSQSLSIYHELSPKYASVCTNYQTANLHNQLQSSSSSLYTFKILLLLFLRAIN